MSIAMSLRGIGRQLDDPASLGRAIDELLAGRAEPPALLALGEPTHGITAFPLLRNDLLAQLVDRGYRSIALEIDALAASIVDDYVCGGPGDVDTVLATGFSHGFGGIPGNRELVDWLRAHNAGREAHDRVRFHGFDAPVEYSGAPSPRRSLSAVIEYLPAALRPASARDLDTLVGAEADWTDQAAMYDPGASLGDSDRARALRLVADDLACALRRGLFATDPTAHAHAVAHARTALGLLRYHAAMATPGPDRIGHLSGVRSEMMAENLLAIAAQGPTLVFAHNAHLRRARPGDTPGWANAGALVGLTLGERYVVVTTDANPDSDPATLQGALAEATTRRALFPTGALRAALPPSIVAGDPVVHGHLPLEPAELADADAVIFVADTDGTRHQYW